MCCNKYSCESYGTAVVDPDPDLGRFSRNNPCSRLSELVCVIQAAGNPGRYQNTDWASAFTSQLLEYDYWVTEVEGEVPDTLRGTLFRNGPGRCDTLSLAAMSICFTCALLLLLYAVLTSWHRTFTCLLASCVAPPILGLPYLLLLFVLSTTEDARCHVKWSTSALVLPPFYPAGSSALQPYHACVLHSQAFRSVNHGHFVSDYLAD